MIARSTLWGTIQLGDDFYLLPPEEQFAVLAHEQGHIYHRHAWKRLKWILTFRAILHWDDFLMLCEKQELEADRYAVDKGYGTGLLQFLKWQYPLNSKALGYPTAQQRIENIHHG